MEEPKDTDNPLLREKQIGKKIEQMQHHRLKKGMKKGENKSRNRTKENTENNKIS